jgi:hypothetical protein
MAQKRIMRRSLYMGERALFDGETPWLQEHFAWALAQQLNPHRRRKRKIKRPVLPAPIQ